MISLSYNIEMNTNLDKYNIDFQSSLLLCSINFCSIPFNTQLWSVTDKLSLSAFTKFISLYLLAVFFFLFKLVNINKIIDTHWTNVLYDGELGLMQSGTELF